MFHVFFCNAVNVMLYSRAEFLSMVNTYNCFLKEQTQLHLTYSQVGVPHSNKYGCLLTAVFSHLISVHMCFCFLLQGADGRVIVEGLLNISWGVRRPIRLKMQDDKQNLPFLPMATADPTSPVSPLGSKRLDISFCVLALI